MPVRSRHVKVVLDLAPGREWTLDEMVELLEGLVSNSEAIDAYRVRHRVTEDTDTNDIPLGEKLRRGRRGLVVAALNGYRGVEAIGSRREGSRYKQSDDNALGYKNTKSGVNGEEILTFLKLWDKDRRPKIRDVFKHFERQFNRAYMIELYDRTHSKEGEKVSNNEKVRRAAVNQIRRTVADQARWTIVKPEPIELEIIVPGHAKEEFAFLEHAKKKVEAWNGKPKKGKSK